MDEVAENRVAAREKGIYDRSREQGPHIRIFMNEGAAPGKAP